MFHLQIPINDSVTWVEVGGMAAAEPVGMDVRWVQWEMNQLGLDSLLVSQSDSKAFPLSKALSDSIPFPLMPVPLSCAYNTLLISILHSPFTPNIMNEIHYDYDTFLCCFWLCFHLQLWLPFVSDSAYLPTPLTFWLCFSCAILLIYKTQGLCTDSLGMIIDCPCLELEWDPSLSSIQHHQ